MLGLLYAVSALVCGPLAVAAWRRRAATPAAGSLAVVMAGLTWWSLCDLAAVLLDVAPERGPQLLLYPGVGAVIAGCYCLCRSLADPDWRPTPRTVRRLAVEPALISLAAVTNPLHDLVIMPATTGPLNVTFGPLFWLHSVYSYALLTWALVLVLRHRRHASSLHARQLRTLLIAAVFPTLGNVATLSGLSGKNDLTAVLFVITGLFNAYAVFRQGLFEVMPIARAVVLERLDAAVLVFDERDRLADLNVAAVALLGRAVPAGCPVPGTPSDQAVGGLRCVLGVDAGEQDVRLVDGEAHLDVRVAPLLDKRGRPLGRVLVLNDVTEATRARRLLTESNGLLQDQLVTIELLRAELAEQAVRDHLTGLHNRRHLSAALAEQVAEAHRTGEPLSVVLFDVDHFKAVNDRYGHAAGDQLLQALGRQLQQVVRGDDTVARYGGEEFVVVLPRTGPDEAVQRAEVIRAACNAIALEVPGRVLHPTLSAGVASTCTASTPDALLEAADQSLYRAKASGRDRVVGPQRAMGAAGLPAQALSP